MEWTDEQQEEINNLIKQATSPLEEELEATKTKLSKELSDAEKALVDKEKALWQKEVSLTLKDAGLGKFDGLIDAKDNEELSKKVESLTNIVNEFTIDNSYKPENHGSVDEYAVAQQKGDTQSMIKSKLSKLFG